MAGDTGLNQPQPSYIDTPEADNDEAMQAAHSVPWVGIAFAVHVLLLVVAWFVLPAAQGVRPMPPLQAVREPITEPPPPVQQPEKESVFPDDQVDKEVTTDHKIVTADDTHSEDPTDSPNKDIADNPNENPTAAESPNPNHKNSNSAVGLGPNGGGGGGAGGLGGRFKFRGPGPGGGKPSPNTEAGLAWLADHQNPEGYWSAASFNNDSKRKDARRTYNIEFVRPGDADGDKGWEQTVDVGLTGLALLAFTTAGNDHKTGEFRNTIRQAIIYLRKIQSNDGCFGPKDDDHFVYNHAICMMAAAEVYGLSGDEVLRPIVDRAVEFTLRAQNPGMGWRYDIARGANDSSVTGWMVLALHTCEFVGVHFDRSKVYGGAAEWFKMVTVDVNGYPRCGYDSPGSPCSRLRSAADTYEQTPSMDAIYIMSMLFMGKSQLSDSTIRALARGCVERDNLPQWKLEKLDMYYWYYASLALYQVGGSMWDTWRGAVMKVLMDNQRGFHAEDKKAGLTNKDVLAEHGSWDAVDAWSSCGGRVYTTAMGVLTLESVKRYERLQSK
ncbi:MAG: terpene cyclase/mutase family protein [Planctomycetes bacterium]|nr:terpene cyclase/mutase family protein [Planctomycetota bacterium]MCW8135950.1 terpene cyclase/mutase family protein [Planctomycetota bacterium]